MFNRLKRGRTLDTVHTSGGDLLCSDMAVAVCAHAGLDLRFNHLDTTSVALTGAYVPDRDEQAMTLTQGYATDHRPDVQQAVEERMVAQDGGVPCVSQSWDGNASDTQMFQERADALITTLQRSSTPRYLVADATRYHEANAASLSQLGCITRMPQTFSGSHRRSPTRSRGTDGPVSRPRPASTVWSDATMAWLSAGSWCRQRRPWSVPKPVSAKPRRAHVPPSTHHSFTCTPNALKRLRRHKRLARRWRHGGPPIRWKPTA